MGDFALN